MFFSWLDQNKNFRKGSNLLGQVTPFLVITLVILLVATIVSVNIGRVSLDKTYSANAADAGSLAAASAWAGAFNSLATTNLEVFKYSYDYTYNTMGLLYDEAEGYIDEVIILCAVAAPMGILAEVLMDSPEANGFEIWYGGLEGGILDISAGIMLFEAALGVDAFNIVVQYMQTLTTDFNESQRENYCNTRDSMAKAWTNANETGFNYAFSNSGIQSKLSDAQGDAYNAWVSGKGPFNDKIYSWADDQVPPQEHTVSASLDLPDIVSYTLQHTVGTYSHIDGVLDDLISNSSIIATALNSAAVMLASTGGIAIIGFAISICSMATFDCCIDWITAAACCPIWAVCWALLEICSALCTGTMPLIVAILEAAVALAGATSVYLLRDDLNDVFDDWAPDGTQDSSSCGDVADLLIVKIDHVTLASGDRWSAIFYTTQNHGSGTSAGVFTTTYIPISSSSTAKFDGGNQGRDIGDFVASYDPGIIGAS